MLRYYTVSRSIFYYYYEQNVFRVSIAWLQVNLNKQSFQLFMNIGMIFYSYTDSSLDFDVPRRKLIGVDLMSRTVDTIPIFF